jgi:hypothetical protein
LQTGGKENSTALQQKTYRLVNRIAVSNRLVNSPQSYRTPAAPGR